eukprot:TRINITY_DN4465_c0_g1_i1.p1 TRINITY_DN4465_c0_g1~~TRINITY_DN4465_c0_g1_i1.p1  ORF type:complete len:821 (+),score=162.87 TRINITY_DN4465_c0_g1_i1:605-3067(+)
MSHKNTIYSVDEDEQKRQAEHKLRPRPIDINQKLEILVHTLEEVEEEKNAIFFSDLTTVQYSDEPEPLKDAAVPIPRITVLKDDGVSKKLKPFTRPKNYIEYKERPDAEVAKSTEYEVDDEDDEFIEALNDRPTKKKETSSLNFDKFENTIDFFEKEVYYKKKLFFIDDNPSINLDPNDIPCAVCSNSKTSSDNPILVCQGCRVSAHQKCCGLKKVSKENWRCERCSQEKKKLSCELCPATDGVFYPKKGDLWVHLACAFSFNEIPIQVLPNGYAIKSFEKMPPSSRTSVCYLCDVRKGACVKCADEDCKHYFHITCALKRGLGLYYNEEITARHKTKSKNHGELAPVLESYCIKHSINTRMLTKNKKHLFVHKEFKQEEIDDLARLGNSSSRKLNLDKETLEVCYRYWMSRRIFIGKPLITRLQEVVKGEKEARKRSTKLIVDEEKYKQLKKIRQSLERTRLLVDLSRKRELAKKSLINHYTDIFEFLVKEQTGKSPKKSPKKQTPAPTPASAKKPVFVKIKKEPGTSNKDDDAMSIEETTKPKPSPKPSPKKKLNGHAHTKAVTPVTKTVNGRLAPSSKKEEANGRSPAHKKSSPATKKNVPNGTSKPTKSPTKTNNNKKKQAVIEIKSQSSSEESESEQNSEQEESEQSGESSSKEEESEKEESDSGSSEKSEEESSEASNEEKSSSEEKSSASESSKSNKSSDESRENSEEESRSGSSSESDEKEDKKPAAPPASKKKAVVKPPTTKTKKETSRAKKPNNRGDRHTKPPPPTRNRPMPILGTPTRKRAPPGQSSSSKKRKRESTSFTSNKKQKLRR